MVRVTGPFLSLDARGSLAKTMVGSYWKGVNYIRVRVVPKNPKSDPQVAVRTVLSDGVSKWKNGVISDGEKSLWETYATGLGMSGFNRFMKFYVPANYDSATQEVKTPQVIPTPR